MTRSPNQSRLGFLDMTKGILVMLMVVYHSLNYTNQVHLAFRYLSFLPPSFILITGFLIAFVYLPRYEQGDTAVFARLIIRGFKLIGIFIFLNICAQYVRSPAYGQSIGVVAFFSSWHEIFVVGAGRTAAFEVLLPIGYLLIISPVLIWVARRQPKGLFLLAAASVTAAVASDFRGQSYANLNLMSAGITGILAGKYVRNPASAGRFLPIAIFGYVLYFFVGLNYGYVSLIQLLGAAVVLLLLAGLSLKTGESGWWQRKLILIGRYSLLAYISQIAALQILSRFVGRPHPLSPQAVCLLVVATLTMLLITEATERLRLQNPKANRLYLAVFP